MESLAVRKESHEEGTEAVGEEWRESKIEAIKERDVGTGCGSIDDMQKKIAYARKLKMRSSVSLWKMYLIRWSTCPFSTDCGGLAQIQMYMKVFVRQTFSLGFPRGLLVALDPSASFL